MNRHSAVRSSAGAPPLSAVEICAGAGGQSLGLERAGFTHSLAVELDPTAASTLKHNRPEWDVAVGDVADRDVWRPADYQGVDLLAGGVPCPPFSIAGRQLGAQDERDLFAWAVEQVAVIKPRALLLENVRGLSTSRFTGYRQHVLDRLAELGYVGEWTVLNASGFGLAQLRPRFVLVALRPEDARFFAWPNAVGEPPTVGQALYQQMAEDDWAGAENWARKADRVGPTIVGGSKKHGGADLGPTRAKRAWAELGVDGMGVADAPPTAKHAIDFIPKLTVSMVATLQGWSEADGWEFMGRKTSQYRQVGNAFPPPVAQAVGTAIHAALRHEGTPRATGDMEAELHDPVLRLLKSANDFVSLSAIAAAGAGTRSSAEAAERHVSRLMKDFHIDVREGRGETHYRLVEFKAFTGQEDHERHEVFSTNRSLIS